MKKQFLLLCALSSLTSLNASCGCPGHEKGKHHKPTERQDNRIPCDQNRGLCSCEKLSKKPFATKLYLLSGCGYCNRVTRELDNLEKSQNLNFSNLERVPLNKDTESFLLAQGGKRMAPCLFIQMEENGPWQHLYESSLIICWFKENAEFYR